ncbi:MAG: hypothetical protein AABY68_12890 [Pseudomonadota bacterium]
MICAAQQTPNRIRARHLAITAFAAVLLAACGGGGGGGSGSGGGTNTPTNTSAGGGSVPVSMTMASDGSARTVNTSCPFTQTIAATRNDGLRIEQVRWLQTVALDPAQSDTRLAGAKAVKLRVDLLANAARATPAVREVRIYDPATSTCTRYTLSGPNSVPTSMNVETLANAFVATIPADKIKPGMGMSIVFDDTAGRAATEADATYRYYLPSVATAQTETIRLIPLTILGNTASVNTANLASVLTRLHPISSVNFITTPPLSITAITLSNLLSTGLASLSRMTDVLDEVDNYCAQLNGSQRNARTAPKCLAFFPDTISFSPTSGSGQIVGLAYVGGIAMITQQVLNTDDNSVISPYANRHWMNYRALTLAHEYGHLLNLDHGACGGAAGIDQRLYNDGRLNAGAGWDEVRDTYFSSTRLDSNNQPQFADLMSYCGKEWASDRGYLAALNYRSASSNVSARTSEAAEQWLKLSLRDGIWQVRPVSFAPATLKLSTLDVVASSDQGAVNLPLYSAVLSDNPELTKGPYFVNLGALQVNQLQIRQAGTVISTWSASTGVTN